MSSKKSTPHTHFVLIQTWWHIEDFYQPYSGHTIRQVMDFATDSDAVQITLPASLFGLRGILRSLDNRELPFTEQKTSDEDTLHFIFQLPLEEMPFDATLSPADIAADSENGDENTALPPLKRAKMEIEYSYLFGNEKSESEETHSLLFDIHTSSVIVPGVIQPEFRITPPYGYTLKTEKTEMDAIYYSETEKRIVEKSLMCSAPAIIRERGREKFTFYLGSDSRAKSEYLHMLSDIKIPKEENAVFRITYTSKISWSTIIMTEFLPVLFVLVLLLSLVLNTSLSVLFTLFAAYIAYVCVYVSYLRDEFALPRQKIFIICLILMVVGIIVYLIINGLYSSVSDANMCCMFHDKM